MQRIKQICALIGIILLVSLYGLTLFAAIFDSTATMKYLSAAVVATVLIPVTIWLLARMIDIKNKNKDK